jgi:small-conductance mechanosensitive channel
MPGEPVPPAAGAAGESVNSGIAPFDAVRRLVETVDREIVTALTILPGLPGELAAVAERGWPEAAATLPRTFGVCLVVALAYAATRIVLAPARHRVGTMRSALGGMAGLAGLELLALLAGALAGRVLLVRGLGILPGAEALPRDMVIALVRWLMGLTLLIILFQPATKRLRLARVDDDGARKAVRRFAILLAIAHLHAVVLASAQRAGLSGEAAKLISGLVAAALTAGVVQVFVSLGRHGIGAGARLLAIGLSLLALIFWLWGWVSGAFALYRGAVGTIVVMLMALALDRAVAVSIRDSRQPAEMRQLFVLRVVIDSLAAVMILRIGFEFWLVGAFGWLPADGGQMLDYRLNFASIVFVMGAACAALVHVWTEAALTPTEAAGTAQEQDARLARLSTVLPILRASTITLIAVVFSLVGLSALGVDITPLMAGAGIVGLAISFGSQALVKDIVSGVFHIVDDVFRIGESVEFGDRRGLVEEINLRSIRLREEDGRLHTLPLGELGAVTNHSRKLVRLSVTVALDRTPDRNDVMMFTRQAAAALRSEPAIRQAIVGDIGAKLNESSEGDSASLVLSFNIGAASAERGRVLIQRLVEEAIDELAIPGIRRSVTVTTDALSSAVPMAGSVPQAAA